MRKVPIETTVPSLANLTAALHEVRYTGAPYYEGTGQAALLASEAEDAERAVAALLATSPEVARFLGVVFLAREERLAAARRSR